MFLFFNRNRCCCYALLNSHWYHGISLTIHGYRFWVHLQNRSFKLWLFCSHFPRSYLILMLLSGKWELEGNKLVHHQSLQAAADQWAQGSVSFPTTSQLQLIAWLNLHHSYGVLVQFSLQYYALNLNSGTLVSAILELTCFSSLKKYEDFHSSTNV